MMFDFLGFSLTLPSFSMIGIWGLFGGIMGWIINLLPIIVASMRRSYRQYQVMVLNMLYIFVIEILAWLNVSGTLVGKDLTLILFTANFIVFWLFGLVQAFRGKR